MSNPWSQAYEDLRKPYLEGKMAKKDYDGDGKIESGTDEYMGSKDKAIKKAMGKKVAKEHHQKDADGKVIEHEDTTPSSVEEEQITELSKKTLGGYVKKASKETRGNMVATQHGSGIPKKARDIKLKQVNKRLKGMEKAGAKMAKEENVDEMITLTKGDYASRNVAGSAYSNAAKKKFDSKIYKAGGGLGSNFLPLANSHEPEGPAIEEAKVDAGKSPETKEKERNIRKFGVGHNVSGHGKLRRSLHRMNRGDKKIKGDKSAWTEMESMQYEPEGDVIDEKMEKDVKSMRYGDGEKEQAARLKKLAKKRGMPMSKMKDHPQFKKEEKEPPRMQKGAMAYDGPNKARSLAADRVLAKTKAKRDKMVKKESFSDWRSEFVWEDGDSVKKI